jgi:hypothetical protein
MSFKGRFQPTPAELSEAKRFLESEVARKRLYRDEFDRLTPMVREVLAELGTELWGRSLGILRRHRIYILKSPSGVDRTASGPLKMREGEGESPFYSRAWYLRLNDRGLAWRERQHKYHSPDVEGKCVGLVPRNPDREDQLVFIAQKRQGGLDLREYSAELSREALEETLVRLVKSYVPSAD